jgi:hypothetical protein
MHHNLVNRCVIIDNFLPENIFNEVSNEMPRIHETSINNIFGELSNGKTTIKNLNLNLNSLAPDIIAEQLTSLKIKKLIGEWFQTEVPVSSLLDFEEKGGHSILHRMLPGSFLDFHVDRSYLPQTDIVKVANALLFLSPSWKDEFGGHFRYKGSMFCSTCERIEYRPNRLVIILHTSQTFHEVTPISNLAPTRYSAYMDFYLPSIEVSRSVYASKYWKHETVYLPSFKNIKTFARGRNYSLNLIKYMCAMLWSAGTKSRWSGPNQIR